MINKSMSIPPPFPHFPWDVIFPNSLYIKLTIIIFYIWQRARRGRDRVVAEFTTTYEIGVYYDWCCEFEGEVQHYVMKFASDLRQFSGFRWVLRFHGVNTIEPSKQPYHMATISRFIPTIAICWFIHITYVLITFLFLRQFF